MEAVDAIFLALEELGIQAFNGPPSALLGRMEQPRVFCDFSAFELREAEQFLSRCGLLGGAFPQPDSLN